MPQSDDVVLDYVKVREVAGVLQSRAALDAAVDDLLRAGFDRADIDVMAGINAVIEKLGGAYVAAEERPDLAIAPRRAYVAREDAVGPLAMVAGVLFFMGAATAALGVVASGGAVAVAAAAATAGGAAGGGLGALFARSLGVKQAGALETQLAEGGIVLWVRVRSPEREKQAEQILLDHGARAVRVHEIEIEKRMEDLPLSSWLADEPLARP
jgi:hypothetical protein